MLPVESAFKTYTGLDGKPLNNGYVYFGKPNQNPITAPVTVYWDVAGTIPAAQPLRTVNGYIIRAGTPANVFVGGSYSELVLAHNKMQVFYARSSDEFSTTGFSQSGGSSQVGFLQSGTGAVQRSVQDKLRERISVKDFGAKGDSSTLDTDAIKSAVASCFGRELYFPAGNYVVDSEILLSLNSMTVRGEGRQMTAIITTSPTADIFRVTGSDVIIDGINFQSRVPRTAGAFVNFQSGAGHTLSNFSMQAPFIGVKMNCTQDTVRDGSIANTVAGSGNSIIIGDTATGFDQLVANVVMDAAPDKQPAAGIALFRTYDLRVESCELQHQGNGMSCLPPDGGIAYAVHAINNFFDSCSGSGVRILVSGTGQANNFRFSNNWFGNNSVDGVRMTCTGSGKVSSLHFENSNVVSNTGNGFTLDTGVEDVTIMGGGIQGCTYGVNVSAGVSDWSVIGVAIGNFAGGGGATQAGITVATGGSDRYVIQGNRFRGNGKALSDGGVGVDKVIAKNSGLATESRGQGNMLVNTSVLVIQHGLGVLPDPTSIVLTPNSDTGTNPLYVDLLTLNETQFTVRSGATRTGGVLFNWQAKIRGA